MERTFAKTSYGEIWPILFFYVDEFNRADINILRLVRNRCIHRACYKRDNDKSYTRETWILQVNACNVNVIIRLHHTRRTITVFPED